MRRPIVAVLALLVALSFVPVHAFADVVRPRDWDGEIVWDEQEHVVRDDQEDGTESGEGSSGGRAPGCSSPDVSKGTTSANVDFGLLAAGIAGLSLSVTACVVRLGRKDEE